MIKVGIVGATGYTGVELLRLLVAHPNVEIAAVTSRSEAGKLVSDYFPNLRGHLDLAFTDPSFDQLAHCDVVFYATPHGVAQSQVAELINRDVRVIDLSADFRIRDVELWEKWYNQPHGSPELVGHAVYGLPERNRDAIANAKLVACPGCYPTASQLALLPLVENGLVDTQNLIVNAASGVSGAGRQGKVANLFAEVADSFKAYGVAGHRHLPEIEQGLNDAQSDNDDAVKLTFVPHLLPMIRGIHATAYATLKDTSVDLQALFESRYENEPFVDVLPAGSCPETRTVKSTNVCRLSVVRPQDRDTVVVMSVIDNLTKGASGQAVQNLNIMFGLPETQGLEQVALIP
ncbi:N-acetyl-gamma-glutamyl-phosphate reductase [Sessilibacter corallicola]|uniref:N-acetyl-gamma-glutamyl-phosphate reductase n=1 Tax=Sessilibacter corallicola TaxID=2904075 RepID=UPI001E49583C|nr:N-acetyl-gamma-glutamyl-phosphate reductase [Sessilibacter corallicola]MCE2030568.1 N-acetyl-gamma-glutamyl-phosphate reductase [Sessilibacter corallicola]